MVSGLFSAKQRRIAAVYVGVWVLLGTLAAVEMYVAQLVWDKPVSWDLAFRRAFKEVLAYAILTLGIFLLCRWVRPEAGRRVRWFFIHLSASLVFALCQVTAVSWLQAGEISVQTGNVLTFGHLFEMLLVSYAITNVFKYWIVALGYFGWHYYKAFRERERQAAALTHELVQARLAALRMQINPHFLFNTLNTISALIQENPDAADRMIVRLSELLRRTLDRSDEQEVPLHEELEFLRGYLEIEQMRFPDRLSVIFEIEPATQNALVPQLILQPLVENALRHGVLPREEAGRIEISSRFINPEQIELKVRDNGGGLTVATGIAKSEGIGLKNVRSRLAQLYGDQQSFEIRNIPSGGVEARICLPRRSAVNQSSAATNPVRLMDAGDLVLRDAPPKAGSRA